MSAQPKRPRKPVYFRVERLVRPETGEVVGALVPRRNYRRQRSDLDRFNALVMKDSVDGCWNWNGTKTHGGYGKFSFGGDCNMGLAHRWSYAHFVGPIRDGMHIDHLCRNRACVNPLHLEAVTPNENARRSVPFRNGATETHCKNGHPWTIDTLYTNPRGRNACRRCRNESMVRYRIKRTSS